MGGERDYRSRENAGHSLEYGEEGSEPDPSTLKEGGVGMVPGPRWQSRQHELLQQLFLRPGLKLLVQVLGRENLGEARLL